MTINQYNIHFFYKQLSRGGGRYEGQFMRAMDEGGKEKWQELKIEERAQLIEVAQTKFAMPFHSGTRETPGGTSNVKDVYAVSEFYPEGHLDVGMWWDNHGEPEGYYKKKKWGIEVASLGEGVPNLKEVRG